MIIGRDIDDKILIGSKYFFDGYYEDFKSHDTDYLILVGEPVFFKTVLQIRGKGKDLMYWKKMPKNKLIETVLQRNFPMEVGKFLIPEFCKKIGFTVEDLRLLDTLFDTIDDKHKYEIVIRDAYIENGEMRLTEEQRDRAYEEYKKYRQS